MTQIKHTQFCTLTPPPYRNKHTQICTLLLGMTALVNYSNQAVRMWVGLELTDLRNKLNNNLATLSLLPEGSAVHGHLLRMALKELLGQSQRSTGVRREKGTRTKTCCVGGHLGLWTTFVWCAIGRWTYLWDDTPALLVLQTGEARNLLVRQWAQRTGARVLFV